MKICLLFYGKNRNRLFGQPNTSFFYVIPLLVSKHETRRGITFSSSFMLITPASLSSEISHFQSPTTPNRPLLKASRPWNDIFIGNFS